MKGLEPLISIIVPVYNTAEYLPRCLNSILNQVYQNLQIIVINDGSTDNSFEICKRFATMDKRVEIFTQINKGLSSVLNKGLQQAVGEWVCFVDSDDWLDNDAFIGLYTMISKYPQIELIRCFNRKVNISGEKKSEEIKKEIVCTPEELISYNLVGGYISSLFIKKIIIDENNLKFCEQLKIEMDMEFTFRAFLKCKYILLYFKVFYNYFMRETSLLNSFSLDKAKNHLTVPSMMYVYSRKYPKVVKNFVTRKLNDGLILFIHDVCIIIENNNKISQSEIRKIIREFIKTNKFYFYKRSLICNILLFFTLINIHISLILMKLRFKHEH